ncbi:von Willebrand factor type A domain-containing protein [Haloactinospora alba]|uniref:von Willebrand factor type A domain-containing protein n=1 Tax=Haloactinospora alba TaxID=405555 RepID=A0A543NGS2_9ACTN|nr:substrate-binding and VWA domain-containing protein [Haloactinospora alba]TQN30940.1 von Willebrand factor type A domain-containing protein [Haloactinospora alba]
MRRNSRDSSPDDRSPATGPPRGRRRRRGGGAVAALAGAAAILLGLGVTGWYVLNNWGGCSGQDLALDVAVSPDLVPAMDEIATRFNEAQHNVDDRCVTADVRGVDPANVAYGITGTGPSTDDAESDVWVPDSSLWTTIVENEAENTTFTDTGTSVATSPLVLAQPEGTTDDAAPSSWKELVPTEAPGNNADANMRLMEPTRNSSGMATFALIADAIGAQAAEESPQFVAAIQSLQQGAAPDKSTAFTALSEYSDGTPPLMALSEQAAWRYNTENSDSPAHVRYPEGGTYTLDYPYVVRDTSTALAQAAERFRETLTKEPAQNTLTSKGFRSAEGEADTDALTEEFGFQEDPPEDVPAPSAQKVQDLTSAWNQFKLDSRMLTIVDVSGSMLEPVPGTDMNRMEVTRKTAIEGLDMLPPGSELGLWRFSVKINNDLDYEELLPVADLSGDAEGGATYKEAMAAEWRNLEPVPDGDTGLYDTYLAAYRQMARSYQSDRVNSILMFTDGNNDDEDSIELDKLVETLKKESDPEQPIPIFTIAFGPDIDPEPLERISEVTGGAAYTTEDPAEIGDIFLEAFAQRLSPPGDGEDPE